MVLHSRHVLVSMVFEATPKGATVLQMGCYGSLGTVYRVVPFLPGPCPGQATTHIDGPTTSSSQCRVAIVQLIQYFVSQSRWHNDSASPQYATILDTKFLLVLVVWVQLPGCNQW